MKNPSGASLGCDCLKPFLAPLVGNGVLCVSRCCPARPSNWLVHMRNPSPAPLTCRLSIKEAGLPARHTAHNDPRVILNADQGRIQRLYGRSISGRACRPARNLKGNESWFFPPVRPVRGNGSKSNRASIASLHGCREEHGDGQSSQVQTRLAISGRF